MLPTGKRLVEPFLGSGALFLNTDFKDYLLCDINPDLITLYKTLQKHGPQLIKKTAALFTAKNNTAPRYYQLRTRFNATDEGLERSALFIYLNRHCYNGLCRYNKSGGFNVPFGLYKKPYFPQAEMLAFHAKAKKATFLCADFQSAMNKSKAGDVVYCDPPYIPLSITANFTNYSGQQFAAKEQEQLALLAKQTAARGIPVLLSNPDTPLSREYYQGAQFHSFPVKRFISCQGGNRVMAQELLALFN